MHSFARAGTAAIRWSLSVFRTIQRCAIAITKVFGLQYPVGFRPFTAATGYFQLTTAATHALPLSAESNLQVAFHRAATIGHVRAATAAAIIGHVRATTAATTGSHAEVCAGLLFAHQAGFALGVFVAIPFTLAAGAGAGTIFSVPTWKFMTISTVIIVVVVIVVVIAAIVLVFQAPISQLRPDLTIQPRLAFTILFAAELCPAAPSRSAAFPVAPALLGSPPFV